MTSELIYAHTVNPRISDRGVYFKFKKRRGRLFERVLHRGGGGSGGGGCLLNSSEIVAWHDHLLNTSSART